MTRYRNIRIAIVLASLVAVPAVAHGREWTKLLTSGHIPSVPAVATLGRSIYLFAGVRDDFATFQNTFFDDLHPFYTKTNLDEALPGVPTFSVPIPASLFCYPQFIILYFHFLCLS